MNNNYLIRILVCWVVMVSGGIAGQQAFAQAKGYVGGMAGMSVPSYDSTTARTGYGFMGGVRLDGELGVGAYFLGSSKTEDFNGESTPFNYQLYGIEGSFHFEGIADGAFLGIRVGTTKLRVGSNINTSPTHLGPIFGYDRIFDDNFSVGVEGSWISVDSSSQSQKNIKNFNILSFNAVAKMWF